MAQLRLHVDEADGGLPMVCMRCGEPATVVKTKKMSWYPRWVIVLILVNVIIFAIVALVLTKRAVLQAPLCDQHKGHWTYRMLIILASLLAIGILVIGAILVVSNLPRQAQDSTGPFICIGGGIVGLAWLIGLVIVQNTAIRPSEITDTEILLENVSEAFIDAVAEADRERLARRRERRSRWDEEEDEPPPRKRLSSDAVEEDDRPRKKPPSDAFEE